MQWLCARALAAVVLASSCASSVLGWVTALHVARGGHHDDPHGAGRPSPADWPGLELALHGHTHDDDTPPHDHESLTRQAATPRAQALARAASRCAHFPALPPPAPSAVGVRRPVTHGHAHGPPARAGSAHILRI